MYFYEMREREFTAIQETFANSNYYQTTFWAKIKEFTGWHHSYVGLKDGNNFLFAAVILWKNIGNVLKFCYIPRGFLGNYHNIDALHIFTNYLKKYALSKGASFIKIDPLLDYSKRDRYGNILEIVGKLTVDELKKMGYRHYGFTTGFSHEIQNRWSYYLRICQDSDIFINVDNRCKRSIKKADNYPLIIKDVDDDNISDFKNIMERTSARHNSLDRSLDYYKNLKNIFGNHAYLKVIYLDKERFLKEFKKHHLYDLVKSKREKKIPLSAGVFIKYAKYMHYIYGGNEKKFMSLMGSYFLQREMLLKAKEEKLQIYDFGGISGNFSKTNPSDGVYEFKKGFGGYVTEYIGEFDLVVKPIPYNLYKVSFDIYKIYKRLLAKIKNRFTKYE